MPKLPQGDIFAAGAAVSGSKTTAAHCWKYCPYSTQITSYNGDTRVPGGEKVFHSETEGQMHTYALGPGGAGWVCADNDCSFFIGTATTEVLQVGRRFLPLPSGTCPKTEEDFTTLSGTVDNSTTGRTIISGTRYLEV